MKRDVWDYIEDGLAVAGLIVLIAMYALVVRAVVFHA